MQKLASLLGGEKGLYKIAKAVQQWMCMTEGKGKVAKGRKRKYEN